MKLTKKNLLKILLQKLFGKSVEKDLDLYVDLENNLVYKIENDFVFYTMLDNDLFSSNKVIWEFLPPAFIKEAHKVILNPKSVKVTVKAEKQQVVEVQEEKVPLPVVENTPETKLVKAFVVIRNVNNVGNFLTVNNSLPGGEVSEENLQESLEKLVVEQTGWTVQIPKNYKTFEGVRYYLSEIRWSAAKQPVSNPDLKTDWSDLNTIQQKKEVGLLFGK